MHFILKSVSLYVTQFKRAALCRQSYEFSGGIERVKLCYKEDLIATQHKHVLSKPYPCHYNHFLTINKPYPCHYNSFLTRHNLVEINSMWVTTRNMDGNPQLWIKPSMQMETLNTFGNPQIWMETLNMDGNPQYGRKPSIWMETLNMDGNPQYGWSHPSIQ